MSIEESEESKVLLEDKSLPFDVQAEEANAGMSLLNVTANSDDTLTERRNELKNTPQAASCSNWNSMPDLSRAGGSRIQNRSGRSTPIFRPMSLREYDEELDKIKKENFNLKIRIFQLESAVPKLRSLEGKDVFKLNLDLEERVKKQEEDSVKKSDYLDGAIKELKERKKNEKDLEREIRELKRDRHFSQRQMENQLAAKDENVKKLETWKEEASALLAEREREIEELREGLGGKKSAPPPKEMDSTVSDDSEAHSYSHVNVMSDRERQIVNLRVEIADRDHDLRMKDREIGQLKEALEAKRNESDLEVSLRGPGASEQTGIEGGSLVLGPETEALISSLETRLEDKEKTLEALREKLLGAQNQLALLGKEHEGCADKIRTLEEKLRTSEENGLKRDKTIQGLVKLMKKEQRMGSTAGATTLVARANADASSEESATPPPQDTPRLSEKFAQTSTPDIVPSRDAQPTMRQLELSEGTTTTDGRGGTRSPAASVSPRTQVVDGLARASTDKELRDILDKIQEFLEKQKGVFHSVGGLRFGVERAIGTSDCSTPRTQVEIGSQMFPAGEDNKTPPPQLHHSIAPNVEKIVTYEDRLKVTEFVRVISSGQDPTADKSSTDSHHVGREGEAVTPLKGEGTPLKAWTPSAPEASWMFGDALAEMTSATELFNRTTNTSQDLGRLKHRLYDLRQICDRLYNKLRGSFTFLKKLLEKLGGAELARQFEEEFGALQMELEESLNATHLIFEEVKTAEVSISGFVSDLQNASRRLSGTPKTGEGRGSRFLSTSARHIAPLEILPEKSTADSASNTDFTVKEIESLTQTLYRNQELKSENAELRKRLDLSNGKLSVAVGGLETTKTEYKEAWEQLETLKEERRVREEARGRGKETGMATDLTWKEWEVTERRCAKYETYAQAIKDRLDRLEKEFGLKLGGTPSAGSPSRSSRYFDKIFDRLERILMEKNLETDKVSEAYEKCEKRETDLKERLEVLKKENKTAQWALAQAKEKYEKAAEDLNVLAAEFEALRRKSTKETATVAVETEWTTTDLEKVELTLRRYENHFHSLRDTIHTLAGLLGMMEGSGQESGSPAKDLGLRMNEICRKTKQRNAEREELERAVKDLEIRVKGTEGSNILLKDAVEKAQATAHGARREMEALQEEYRKAVQRREGRDASTWTEVKGEDMERTERRVNKYTEYIQMVKERVGKFKEEIGFDKEKRETEDQGSPSRSRKMDKIFDDLTGWILSEREEGRRRIEEARKEWEEMGRGQGHEDLDALIQQLNRNNRKLEIKLREAEDSMRESKEKENVPPADPGHNYEALLREIEVLKQENGRLQEQLVKTMEMLTNTQERLTAKTSTNDQAKDGIVKELGKIASVLKQSRQDLLNQQKHKAARKAQEKIPRA